MKLYLDEDCMEALLIKLLRSEGHDVQLASDIKMMGEKDPVQLRHAIIEDRAFITRNHDDFLELHELVIAAHGGHHGVLVIRSSNDATRDMSSRAIVRAVGKLEASGITVANEFHVLNQWR